ncbi:LysR family transcriptional regulator, partial [bacterium]|nr:LysR family transcriptional regulator [bacterium]
MVELVQYFVKVVQFGNFSRAAEHLQVPKSTLSKAVSKLEKQTNSLLLVRTTRSLKLTPAGKVFFESCVEPLQKIEEAH